MNFALLNAPVLTVLTVSVDTPAWTKSIGERPMGLSMLQASQQAA